MKKTTNEKEIKKKIPWLAGILNFVFPGIGYLYLGRRRIFAIFLLIGMVLGVIEATLLDLPSPETVFSYLISIVFLFAFAYDGYMEAKKINEKKIK